MKEYVVIRFGEWPVARNTGFRVLASLVRRMSRGFSWFEDILKPIFIKI